MGEGIAAKQPLMGPGDHSRLEEEWSASSFVSFPFFVEQTRKKKKRDQHNASGLLSPT